MQEVGVFVIFFASIFTSNILLTNFLGMCSYLSVSRELKTAWGLGVAVVFVMTITSVANYAVFYFILVPLQLEYLQYISFIIVIAALVQVVEMIIERTSDRPVCVPGDIPAFDNCKLRCSWSHFIFNHKKIRFLSITSLWRWKRDRVDVGNHGACGHKSENAKTLQGCSGIGRAWDSAHNYRNNSHGIHWFQRDYTN